MSNLETKQRFEEIADTYQFTEYLTRKRAEKIKEYLPGNQEALQLEAI